MTVESNTQMPDGALSAAPEERAVWPSLARGWQRRCPHCGEGALFDGYLKVKARCGRCGEDLSHQRADDGPAYLTILVVGHLMAPIMHYVAFEWRPDPLVMALVLSLACVALSLYLLPRLKGCVVAYQWAKRMHGFDHKRPAEGPAQDHTTESKDPHVS